MPNDAVFLWAIFGAKKEANDEKFIAVTLCCLVNSFAVFVWKKIGRQLKKLSYVCKYLVNNVSWWQHILVMLAYVVPRNICHAMHWWVLFFHSGSYVHLFIHHHKCVHLSDNRKWVYPYFISDMDVD